MNEQAMTLKTFMRTLAEAAAYANDMLHRDQAAKARELGARGLMAMPHPLSIAGMRVSFAANVKDGERLGFQENGGDLCLDFANPDGNFKGEIIFKPCAVGEDVDYEYDGEYLEYDGN